MEPIRGDATLNVTVIQCVELEKETKRQGKGHARGRSEEGDSWHSRGAGVRDQEWQGKRSYRELMMSSFLAVQIEDKPFASTQAASSEPRSETSCCVSVTFFRKMWHKHVR